MKIRPLIPTALLLLAQVPIAWAVFLAMGCAKTNWAETLGGAELPLGTTLALGFGLVVPIVAALASVLVGATALSKQSSCLGWLFGTAVCEAVLLALLALGLVQPVLTITWGIRR